MSGTAPENAIRILVAGGQRLLVEALRNRLDRSPRFDVVGVAFDDRETVAQAGSLSPHVVLLDVTHNDLDAVAAAKQLAAQQPAPKIVILTDEDTEIDAVEAHRAGAVAFLRKPPSTSDLVETLELVTALMVDTARAQSGS